MRRTRPALFGAVLAIIAAFCLIGLSSWHSAVIHDDDPVHLASVEHSHGSPTQSDPDGPVHVLAHATGQWIGLGELAVSLAAFAVALSLWLDRDAFLRAGIDPAKLLRPPRG